MRNCLADFSWTIEGKKFLQRKDAFNYDYEQEGIPKIIHFQNKKTPVQTIEPPN